jgi:hypothetical protein
MTDTKTADMRHPGQPRDIDLVVWLDGVGFHPADTELKQRGHEAAQLLVALLATHLHQLLPPGRDKSLVYTHLEDVLVRSNRSLALGDGPKQGVTVEGLAPVIADAKALLAEFQAVVPYDPRITEYEEGQRARGPESRETLGGPVFAEDVAPLEPFEYRTEDAETHSSRTLEAALTGAAEGEPSALITATFHDEGENTHESAHVWIDDPEVLEQLGSYALAMANQLRALQAR